MALGKANKQILIYFYCREVTSDIEMNRIQQGKVLLKARTCMSVNKAAVTSG